MVPARHRWAHRWRALHIDAARSQLAPQFLQRFDEVGLPMGMHLAAPQVETDALLRGLELQCGRRWLQLQWIDQQHQAEVVMLGQRAPARGRNADGLLRIGQHQHTCTGAQDATGMVQRAFQAKVIGRGCAYQRVSASSTRSTPRGPPAGAIGGSRSLPRRAPMRSPRRCADHAATAPARAACTDLKRTRVPKYRAGEVSATIRLTRSRSAWNSLVWARPVRAVTRQSICRASSPATYSRDSAYSMPRPRSGDGACPALPARPRRGGGGRCARRRKATSSDSCGRSPSPSLTEEAWCRDGSVMRRLRVPAPGPAAPAPGVRHPSLRQ